MVNKKLVWSIALIIVLTFTVGIISGALISAVSLSDWVEKYPTVNCILNLDDGLNIENNKMPFTKESQREAIQWRCAKQFVNFSITDYEEIFVMEE